MTLVYAATDMLKITNALLVAINIAARDCVSLMTKDFCNAAHAYAANANKMQMNFFSVHIFVKKQLSKNSDVENYYNVNDLESKFLVIFFKFFFTVVAFQV